MNVVDMNVVDIYVVDINVIDINVVDMNVVDMNVVVSPSVVDVNVVVRWSFVDVLLLRMSLLWNVDAVVVDVVVELAIWPESNWFSRQMEKLKHK